MRVLCAQLDIVWEDKAANHSRLERLVQEEAPPPDSLLVLPEMFATGFTMNVRAIAESESGASQRFLADLARRYRLFVMGGVATTGAGERGRNECVVYSPQGEQIARYVKLHPFSLGGESRHYEPGDTVATFRCGGFEVAPFICYDLRFPEIFRSAVRRGATLMAVMANWPSTREHHWTALLQARAIENQSYVVGVNRCGRDPTFHYTGGSMIVGPDGKIVAVADSAEGVISADLDAERLHHYRRELPFLEDMRSDFVR